MKRVNALNKVKEVFTMKKLIMIIILTSFIACQNDDQSNNTIQVNSIAEIIWPKNGGDLRNTNRCKETRPMDVYPGPQLGQIAWQVDVGACYSSPSVDSDGVIYIASYNTGKFQALSPAGSILWNGPVKDYWGDIAISAPGRIYASNRDSVYVFSDTGVVEWRYGEQPQWFLNPVIGSDGTLYIGGSSYMFAFNSEGSLKWRLSAACGSYTGVALCDDRIYFNGTDGVYAVTLNGTLIWKYNAALPRKAVIDAIGNIYFHSQNGTWLTCIGKNGHMKWQFDFSTIDESDHSTYSAPALDKDGRIYAAFNHYVHAFDFDGDLEWTFTLPRPVGISSPVIDCDGNIYICTYHDSPSLTDSSFIYKISRNGEEIWHLGIPGHDFDTTPAIGPDGKLYVGTNADSKGYLLAIE